MKTDIVPSTTPIHDEEWFEQLVKWFEQIAKLLPGNILGNFVQTLYNDPEITKVVFTTEGKRIDKLTFEFRTNTGAIFQFCGTAGANDPASAPTPTLQTSITLRIVVRDRIIG